MSRLLRGSEILGILITWLLFGGMTLGQSEGKGKVTWEEYWKLEARLGAGTEKPMESIDLGGQRQLFVDNYVVEHLENVKKVLHQPDKHLDNPILRPERPWEERIEWANVIRDAEEGIFKIWYLTGEGLAYATSRDALTWERPELGIREFQGSRNNNLVREYITSPTIFKDPYETDPERRYKCFGLERKPNYSIYVSFSPDGLHWKRKEAPVLTSANDPGLNDRPNMMFDRVLKRYVGLTKREMINPFGRGDWGMIHRTRAASVSYDFETWSDPVLALHPDDQDPPEFQIYGLVGFNYEGFYLGLMDVYWSGERGPRERTLDTQLVLSRDGLTWWRAGDRGTFMPLGPEGSWDRFVVAPNNSPPIRVGEELWIFYRGGAERHRAGPTPPHRRREPWLGPGHPEDPALPPGVPSSGMGLAKLRLDGFVSVDAGPRPGRILTRPLLFEGQNLHVNVDATRGSLRAELYQAESVPAYSNSPSWGWAIGEPLDGFFFQDCVPLEKNTTDGILRWKGGDLSSLAGRPIVIRFQLVQASLFSFWVR